jgi:hypothetical protein
VLEARVVLREGAFEEYNNRRPHRGHGHADTTTVRRLLESGQG